MAQSLKIHDRCRAQPTEGKDIRKILAHRDIEEKSVNFIDIGLCEDERGRIRTSIVEAAQSAKIVSLSNAASPRHTISGLGQACDGR